MLAKELLDARDALTRQMLKNGATNKEILQKTKAEYEVSVSPARIARLRSELGLRVRPGRKPSSLKPESTLGTLPLKRRRGKAKVVVPPSAAVSEVDGLLKQLVVAMGREKIVRVEVSGKTCTKEQMIRG